MMHILSHEPYFIVPILHETVESAAAVRKAFLEIQPDCVVVEISEPLQDLYLRACRRLPDVSILKQEYSTHHEYLIVSPTDAFAEATRSALENSIPIFCIDLAVGSYPSIQDPYPDSYAISRIGSAEYYFQISQKTKYLRHPLDDAREIQMSKRIRELSFSYDRILVVTGMHHVQGILNHIDDISYPQPEHIAYKETAILSPTDDSLREILKEYSYIQIEYEKWRNGLSEKNIFFDRRKIILSLIQKTKANYEDLYRTHLSTQSLQTFFSYLKKWCRVRKILLPDLYQLITASKGTIDVNFSYELWKLATSYEQKNIDMIEERAFSAYEIWGDTKKIHFRFIRPKDKTYFHKKLKREKRARNLKIPPTFFSICSWPKEDKIIEGFGNLVKKRGLEKIQEEKAKVIPFTTSIEDGIDTRETIRHWTEKKIFVSTRGKLQEAPKNCVIIFEEDAIDNHAFPWCLTWHGEHEQESDMAFYALDPKKEVIGPGICKSRYGGLMLSSPPGRLFDIWSDPEYAELSKKDEVLIQAAIDYSITTTIVVVAAKPPREYFKQYARRQGKKICYIPLSQFPKYSQEKLRTFHVLDGHKTRAIADEFID